MPFKNKKTGHWHADIRPRVLGKPIGKRLRPLLPKVKTRPEAEEAERRLLRDIQMELSGERKISPQFEEFAKGEFMRWVRGNKKHPDDDERRLAALLASPHFRKRLDEITPDDVEKFKADRKATISRHGRKLSAGSINIELATLSALFRVAMASGGKAKSNPVLAVNYLSTEAVPFRILEHAEEPRLMERLQMSKGHMKPLAQIALLTGMRLNEILGLRVEDVDFGRDMIYVRNPKWPEDRRKTEGIPISQEARNILLSLKVRRGLFFSTETGARLKRVSVSVRFGYLADRAGLGELTFHSLRHTFGTRLAEKGFQISEIARLMGHSSTQMTLRYVHPSEDNLRAAVERLSEKPKVLDFPQTGQQAGNQRS